MKKSAASVFGKIFAKVLAGILVVCLVGVCAYEGVILITDRKINENMKNDNDDTEDMSGQQTADRNKLISVLYTKSSGAEEMGDAIVRMFDKDSREFQYVLIPAELRITLDDITYQQLQADSDSIPKTFMLKELPKYFSDGTAQYKAANRILKGVLGLKYIDFYDTASMEGLVSIINLIDPVEFQVPRKMVFKNQDGINEVLRKGSQELIGNQAVGLLRYTKGYSDPTGQRVKLGVKYWRAYFKAVADLDKKELQDYYKEYYKYVNGSGKYELMEPYMKDIGKSNSDLVTVRLLPGASENDAYVMDQTKAASVMKAFVTDTSTRTQAADDAGDGQEDPDISEGTAAAPTYTIEVVNAAQIAGTAGKWQETLTAAGYQVIGIDTASEQRGDTVIYVSREGIGQELLAQFPGAQIETGDTGEADVRILVGLDYAQ